MPIGRSAGDVYVDGHFRLASDFGRKMSRDVQGPAERAATEASHHFGRKFAAGLAIGGALIGAGLVKATRAAVRGIQATTDKASDLNETINKTNVIFGKNAAEIQKWSRGSARNMGLSRQEALANASAFGDMFLQLKIGQPQAVKMSEGMVQLAADFASFHNADISDVLLAQQSAFRGEYDALQRFVPGINAARVEQEALRETHKKSAKDLTLADKAQATYNIMLKDGTRASGDFARTSNQLANTRRIEKAQIEDLQAAIGQRFLPAQLALHRAMSTKLLPALGVLVKTYGPAVEMFATRWATSFARAIPSTKQLSLGLRALGEAFKGEGITTSSDSFVGKMERIGVAARKVIDWFHQLRPQFSGVGRSASQVGPALTQAGGAGHLFANSLAIVAPVLDVVARNIHNILPWLPALVAGFLAFRAVRGVIAPIRDLGETIAHFTSPATAVATFLNARANKALAVALTERSIAEAAAGRAAAADAVATTTAGNAAQVAAGRFAFFSSGLGAVIGKLGLLAAAFTLAASANTLVNRSQSLGARIHAQYVAPIYERLGIYSHQRVAQLQAEQAAQRSDTEAKRQAALAGYRHADAVRGETSAIEALKGALRDEKVAELDVRQAKLNVSSAQARLTQLTKGGQRGSIEYKQAQIDLKRAQIDLRDRTVDYRAAQLKANAATGGAMRASQQATPPVRNLGEAARVGGGKAGAARIPWRKLGEDVSSTYREIHSKSVSIKANFGWQGLKVFRTPGGALAIAKGGKITRGTGPTADDVPAWLSRGETVVSARDSAQPEFRQWATERRIPGFAAGGRIPSFGMRNARGFVGALGDWDTQVNKVMDLATSRFKRLASKMAVSIPHAPGSWRLATNFLSQLGIPYSIVSTFRPGARTHASGRQSYHALNRAVDLDGGHDKMRIWAALTRTNPTELIYSRAPYYISRRGRRPIGALDPITRADHYSHVHAAYDRGGFLPTGTSVATNRTGRPERVVAPQEVMTVHLDSASARMVAEHVVRGLHSTPIIVSIDGTQVRTAIRNSQRRSGIPAREQVR